MSSHKTSMAESKSSSTSSASKADLMREVLTRLCGENSPAFNQLLAQSNNCFLMVFVTPGCHVINDEVDARVQ